ncbi:hypothetical protein FNYG_08085 [Fusarium nygamai]|uniref:C2H2-type domain-containing protein n=1 Tax=Gibberella nygamai TaxID=42673 RepID=A0A2K0W8H4_GIBNY|nr:hypothetical protein FNYG_08085 [Fusarium nygamai]
MNTVSADGRQAESNEGPPSSKHGQLPTVPEWAPKNLDVKPSVRVYDGVNDEYLPGEYVSDEYSFAPDMNAYNPWLPSPMPPGFVGELSRIPPSGLSPRLRLTKSGSPLDPSLIHPSLTSMTIHPQEYPTPSLYSASPTIAPSPQTSTDSPGFLPYGNAPSYFQPPVDPSEQKRSIVSFQPSYSGDENKEKLRYSWPDCDKAVTDLKDHMLTHQNERPEKCPIQTCEYHTKGFARKYDKNRHTLTHYKGTMVCGFCPGSGSAAEKSFNRADVFKRHLTAVHGVEQTPPNSRKKSSTGVNASKKLTGYAPDATGKCSTCSQTFSNAQDFYEHLDDCVLRIVQQEDPAEAINAKRLAEVENDKDVHMTLEKNNLPTTTEATMTQDDEEEADTGDEDDADNSPRTNTSPTTRKKGNPPNGVQKSRGVTHSRGGVTLTKARSRKNRRDYPPWGFDKSQMKMKKRVMAVFDSPRRLAKDDMMLSTDDEIRIKLQDGQSYVTDLDVQALRRAEAFLGPTAEKKNPWILDHPTEEDMYSVDGFPSAVGEDESPTVPVTPILGSEETDRADLNAGNCEAAPGDSKKHEEAQVLEAHGKGFVDDEIPYTDTGYASCANQAAISNALSKVRELISATRQDADEEDARTTYSAATSVDAGNAQDYISDLSHHIHTNLQHYTDYAGKLELCRSLPELVKALAIKIGCESPSQLNRDIMYFIHKHQREIAKEIERLLLGTDDDASGDARKADPDGMSLLDKMNLWENNAGVDKREADQGELFDAVEDQEEEIILPIAVPRYNKIILDSSAYSWFITNLRKECSLQRGATKLRHAIDDIRQAVLDKLPSGRISKRTVPPRHRCTFRLLLAPLRARLYHAYHAVRSKWASPTRISEVVVVTCSSDEAQVMTVGEYFAQTWPSAGTVLLDLLQQVLGGSDGVRPQVMLSDTTGIAAQTHGSYLVVTVDGLAYSIVECAEQLAWLASAIHPPRNNSVTSCRPLITSQNPPVLAFDIDVIQESMSDTHSQHHVFLHKLLEDIMVPVVVHGFATARRPESCPGLELPFGLLLEAAGASGTTVLDGFHFLNGSRVHLKMVERFHNVFYWHEIDDATGSSHGTSNSLGRGPNWVNPVTISKTDLETGRHIVCGGKSASSYITDKADSISTHTVSMVDTSLTDDILSIPSDSEDVDYQEQNSTGFRFFKRLLSRLVLAFQADAEAKTKNKAGAGDKASSPSTQGAPNLSPAASSLPTLEPRRKRPREIDGNSGGEDDNEDGSDRRQPKRPRAHQPNYPGRSKYLACPFWKLDPDKHRICLFKKLTAISYVKQHLVRQHTPAFYCATCFMVFEDFSLYDRHAVERTCQRSPTAKLEGISHDKTKQLRRKSKPGPVQEQWLAIWRVLFPDRPQPSSVYVDSDLSEDFCLLREFSQRHGVPILLEQLRSDGLTPRLGVSERELQETLRRGMDVIFERFHLNRPSGSPTSVGDSPEMSSDCLAPEKTSAASSADSGVAMGSHSFQNGSRAIDVVLSPWNLAANIPLEEEAMGRQPDDLADMSSILDSGSWDGMGDGSQLANFDELLANICFRYEDPEK